MFIKIIQPYYIVYNIMEGWKELTIEKIRIVLESMISEEDLLPYKNLGNGFYELPGNIICNKKGLNEYLLKIIKNEI